MLALGSVLSLAGTVSVGRTGVRDMQQLPRVLGQGPPPPPRGTLPEGCRGQAPG